MKIPGRVTFFAGVLLFVIFVIFEVLPGKSGPLVRDSNVQGVSTDSVEPDEVKEVVDGDTFVLSNGEKVRLIGVNSPEQGQPYYAEAKSHLEKLLSSQVVKLITDTQVQDQYGRILAYVYNDSDLDINLDMVRSGFAISETVPPNVSRVDAFIHAQREAKNNCLGMWEGLCGQVNLCVQISNIQAKSNDGKNGEWIEFFNTCKEDIQLSGYLLKDTSAKNTYKFGNTIIPGKKTIKLYSGCGVNSELEYYWECPERQNFVWNDTGDRAYLFNNEGMLVSELGY